MLFGVLFWFVCAVMWGLHVDYIISAVEHTLWCGQYIYSGAHANDAKYIISAFGHIVDCSELIWGISTDIVVWCLHMNYLCVAFEGIFLVGTYMAILWNRYCRS